MKEKTLGIILGVLNLILIAVCLVFYLGKDRTAPEITLGEVEYVYEEDLPEQILLEAVTAWDAESGDLTGQVVVEKVVMDQEHKTATITYGVADEVGNVSRASRTLEMPIPERVDLPTAGEAGNVEVAVTTTNSNEQSENREAVEGGTTTGSNEETEEAAVQTVGGIQDIGRPTIIFSDRELAIKVGETPEWESVMEEVQDDKDARDILLETLEVKGEYDVEKAGSYYVTLSITDRDGNTSNAYPLRLLVEE